MKGEAKVTPDLPNRSAPRVRLTLWRVMLMTVAVGLGIVSGVAIGSQPRGDDYEVHIGAWLAPSMTAPQVAEVVKAELAGMGRAGGETTPINIESMSAMTGESLTRSGNEPGHVGGEDVMGKVFWLVWAEGPFYGPLVPPGNPPARGNRGYFVVDDSIGLVVDWAIPR